ncbi:MAG: hypothetical protein WKF84_28725 [Pyrinomonadaceae bacterium]
MATLPIPLYCLSTEASAATSFIRVAADSVVQHDRLTLGDIAEVRAENDEAINRLKAINLGYAPQVGAVREIERRRILLALAAAGYNEGVVAVTAPEITRVRRAAQRVERELIIEAAENALLSDLRAQRVRASLVRLDLPDVIEVSTGRTEVRASAGTVRNLYRALRCIHRDNGRRPRRPPIGRDRQGRSLCHSCHSAPGFERWRQTSRRRFDFVERAIDQPLTKYIRDARQLRGMSLRQPLIRGDVLQINFLNAEIVVKTGDAVEHHRRSWRTTHRCEGRSARGGPSGRPHSGSKQRIGSCAASRGDG